MEFINVDKYRNAFGIYRIRNTATDLVYIGQTRQNFYKRYLHHQWLLRRHKHDNAWLQKSFNKYGEDCFCFEIVESVTDVNLLNDLEIHYIMKARESGHCCNFLDGGGGRKGIPLTEERKRELGALNRRLNTGKKASNETKLKMSRARKGKKRKHEDIQKAVDTRTKNILDGTGYKTTKLTPSDVVNIKKALMQDATWDELAEKYHVSSSNINAIRSNRSWKYIDVDGWQEFCEQNKNRTKRTRQSRSA